MSRRLASEDQMSSLAQITAILGSGGGMRRERKAEDAELKRQAKRERKQKRQRKPETGGGGEQPVVERDRAATGDTLDTPNVVGIALSNVLPALGLRQVCPVDSDAVSAVAPPDDVVAGGAESTEGGACDVAPAASDDSSRVVNAATDGSSDTQLCPSEPEGEKSQDITDVTTRIQSSPDDTETVVESFADTDINPVISVALNPDGVSDDAISPLVGDTTAHTQADDILHQGSVISLVENDASSASSQCNAILPEDGSISLPKTDDVSLPTTGETTLPQDGDVTVPSGDGSHALTPESCVSPLCSDTAATAVIDRDVETALREYDTEAVASEQPCLPAAVFESEECEPTSVRESDQCVPAAVCESDQCEPATLCEPAAVCESDQCEPAAVCESVQCEPTSICESDQCKLQQCEPSGVCDSEQCEPQSICESVKCEPVTTTLPSPVTDDEYFEGAMEDSWEIAESSNQNCVEPVDIDSAVGIACDVPSIPQTDGSADVIEDTSVDTDECFYPCSAVSFDDDVRVHECDSHEGASPVDNGVSCDSIKLYRASPPPPTPPAIRALAEGTTLESSGDVPTPPVDSLLDKITMDDGGDSSAVENDALMNRPNRHGKHAKKVADSPERRHNSESIGQSIAHA